MLRAVRRLNEQRSGSIGSVACPGMGTGTGEMPAGYTAEDLRAMGLPLPGELVREEQPDGTILIRQVAPASSKLEPKNEPTNKFVCE